MPRNIEASGGTFGNAMSSIAGFTQKAILEIADTSEIEYKEVDAPKPSSGAGLKAPANINLDAGSFDVEALANFKKSLLPKAGPGKDFELYGNAKKFRFEVQFNPDELYINGYGGEELPIQKYRTKEDIEPDGTGQPGKGKEGKDNKDDGKIQGGSTMASASTRIDMSFKIAFDKSNPQDAFYADKFTLSQTSIGLKKTGKLSNSVQPEVEALTAIVRNGERRLVRFAWGDMAYEGVLNSVNAEYVMFNINGEPCRAFVSLSMVLYDAEVAGANTDIWQNEYQTDFYSMTNLLGTFGKPKI